MTRSTIKTLLSGAGAAALLAGSSLFAGESATPVVDEPDPIKPWTFSDLFDKKYFYKSEDGFIRGARFLGRYQGQWISNQEEIGGSVNNGYHEFQHRRFRLGFEVEMDYGLTFYIESNVADVTNLTSDRFINDHNDLYLEWEPNDDFLLRLGKQKQNFTLEDAESSKRIKTVERSAIVNETSQARPWGLVSEIQTGDFRHEVGGWLYGGHASDPNWIDFQSNVGFSYNVYYSLSDSTTLHFDYVYADNAGGSSGSEGQAAVGFGPLYQHSFAIGAEFEKDKFQLISDIILAANREGQSGQLGAASIQPGNDTWGFYVLPSYDITDKLEVVGRYAYMAEGREHHSQRWGSSTRTTVEDYHTFYAGLQYFIFGEKLKLQGGYEYATGNLFGTDTDINNGTWQFGIRTYW
ncbi:MAG: porin [Verrucomicrobiota bacterium]